MGTVTNLWAAKREKLAQAHQQALKDLIEHMDMPLVSMGLQFSANGELLNVQILIEPAEPNSGT